MNILIADDNADNRKLLRVTLEAEGHTILAASDGEEALAILGKEPVDAIVSDILMPNMDGYRLCYEVRQSEVLREVPFVFYTNTYLSPGDEKLALEMGADVYLRKPSSTKALLGALERAVASGHQAPEGVSESDVLRSYSVQLVAKLEERNSDLLKLSEELHAAQDRLRHMLAHSPGVLYTLRIEGDRMVPVVVSDNIERLLGVPASATDHAWWLESLHPEDQGRVRETVSRALHGEGCCLEYRLRHADGRFLWVEDRNRVVRDAHGRVVEIVGLWTDITARKDADISLRLLGSAVQQAKDSFMITDAELDAPGPRILFVNPAFSRLTGYSPDEVLGKTPRILQGPRTDRAVLARLRQTLGSGESFEGEVVNYRRDGSEFDLEWQVSPVRDNAGTITHFIAVQHDITSRKTAEKALRDSEERFRQLAENINEVFWISDPVEHRVLYVSPAYELIWGRRCADLYADAEGWLESVHPADRGQVVHASRNQQANGFYDVEYRIVRPDHSVRWIRDRAFPVRNEEGQIYRIVGVAEDITEQRKSGEALRMQGRVLESMAEGVMVWDEAGEILFSNAACGTVFGYEAGELPGKNLSILVLSPSDGGDAFLEQLPSHLEENGAWMGDLNCRKKDGSVLTVKASVSGLEIGEMTARVGVFEDITERRGMELQLLRSQRMESVGRLSSGIAHDLNNILTPILMCVSTLGKELPPEDLRRTLDTIESSARRGADLVKQLLSFGRGTTGRRQGVSLKDLILDLGQMIKETFPRNILFSPEIPDDIRPVTGDPTQLHQVLLNLCVNARDAMPGGGVLTLRARNVTLTGKEAVMNPGTAPGPYVRLEISDTGEGIPPEVIDKIFDPFFTTKPAGQGTGLGLSTVIGIVKSHQGFVNLHSRRGEGTTFEIHLPGASGVTACPVELPAAAAPPKGAGEMILVVDDEPGIRRVVEMTLRAHGYRVLTAGDGLEAVSVFSRHHGEISAILTDVMMPGMDGVAMAKILKKMIPEIKILAASGIGDAGAGEDKTSELSALGITSFLKKPFSAAEVLGAVHALLHES